MLNLYISEKMLFDERSSKIIHINSINIILEHSLMSIAKWESKYNIPFIHTKEKTKEQMYDYISMMCITKNVNSNVFHTLSAKELKEITNYLNAPMTATTISKQKNSKHSNEIYTAEVIYYYMIKHGIPFECQKWHINRLMMLINVCSLKDNPTKMDKQEQYKMQRELNEKRLKEAGL